MDGGSSQLGAPALGAIRGGGPWIGRRAWRYVWVLALVGGATWLHWLVDKTPGFQAPFIFYFPVLIGSAWWFGPGPTLLALAAAVPLALGFFMPHSVTILSWGGWLTFVVFVTVGLGMAAMSWRREETEKSQAAFAAELSLRNTEVHELTEALPVLMASLDVNQRFVFVNRFARNWYGLSEEEIIGKHVRDIVDEKSYARVAGHLADAIAGKSVRFESFVRYPTGEKRWVDASYVPRLGQQGQIRGIHVVAVDISQRRLAEQALRESEERFRQLADAMPQIVWAAGPDGAIEYVNQRWFEYTGEPSGTPPAQAMSRVHSEDAPQAADHWHSALKEGQPFEAEVRIGSASRAYRWFLVRAVPVRDEAGSIIRWFGTSTDIEDQKQVEWRLKHTVEELNRINKDLEEFAHLASHDLKEPLRGIRSFTSFVLEDTRGKLDAEVVRKLHVIDRLSERMSSLISTVLYYSQVGRAELVISPVDLGQVAHSVVTSMRPIISEAGATVDTGPLPRVECDATRAAEVFKNLITNAIRFNRNENPMIELGVAGTDRGWPVLFVKDNGIGIPTEHHQTVFKMFKRLHGREEFGGGMGAGLALVKKIVERHRGRVWIEPTGSVGTTVCFTLGSDAHAVDTADSDR